MDKDLLEYNIKKRGVKTIDLCKKIGISRTAFYRKCNGTSDFTLTEVKKIVEALCIDDPTPIFFADKVS
jgi:predicted transcriptional regulator